MNSESAVKAEIHMLHDLSPVKSRLKEKDGENFQQLRPRLMRRGTLEDLKISETTPSNINLRDMTNEEEVYVDSRNVDLSPRTNTYSKSEDEYVQEFTNLQPQPKPRSTYQSTSSISIVEKHVPTSLTHSTSSSKISSDTSMKMESWFIDEESTNMFDSIPITHPQYELMSVSKEMYMRERSYCTNLRTLVMMKQALEKADYSMPMFKDLECLCGFHEMLLKEMRTICSGDENYANIYKAFLGNFINFLNVYKGCIPTLQQGLTAYSTTRDRDIKFLDIIHNYVAGKEDISLISRIPRHITFYPILLQRVVDLLPENSDSKLDAKTALEQVTEIVKQTNEHVAKMTASVQKCQIMSKLGAVTLAPSDAAIFIKKGKVQKLSKRTDTRLSKRKLYLFSDILYVKDGSKVKREMQTSTMRGLTKLDLLPGKDKIYPFRFRILADKGSLDLVFATEKEMNEWKHAISQTYSDVPTNRKSTDDIVDWYKNEETTMCMHCSKEFNLINRRHHCRTCGRIICGACSLLLDKNDRESRLCLKCYQEKFPEEFNKLSPSKKKRTSQFERKASLTKTDFFIGVTYERFDCDRRTKDGKFFCFVSNHSKLAFYSKPLDIEPKFVVDGTNQKVFLCPAVISRSSDSARLQTNCVAIYDSSSSTLHLLTVEETQKKKEFIGLLQQSCFNCEASAS